MQLSQKVRSLFAGVSTKSQLFDSLEVYLNNKSRLQPIIGLSSIIECKKAGTHNREAMYLCEVCVCQLSKADMRNHIMGSLHRYNYIKAWHPHLVSEWKERSDLSKLAWPLMEMARILEEKEGPGDVQLLKVEDAVYQKMATHNENIVTLINILRDGHGEPESHSETTSVQLEHCPIQSQRIVLPPQNQQTPSKKSLKASAETPKPPSLIQSTVASVRSEGLLNNTSLWDDTQTSPELSVLSENRNSFLDGFDGKTEPLIGLFRVVECRSEDGHTYCFLCHCCRIRSNKKDIIDHLTSSSHRVNYLMETHPEQVEVMMTDINDNDQLLQSLAKKVEQEEGRGELKVVNAPESLCTLLTGKSYHWCIKMLCNGWTHTNIQKRKIAVKGPRVNKTSNQCMPEKYAAGLSKWAKGMTTKRKTRKARNTVFKVSLPLTKGSVLLERMSFSVDSLPVSSTYSPTCDQDLSPSPESQSEDCDLDCDTGSFTINRSEHTSMCTTSQLQQDLCSGDADIGQYMGPKINLTVTKYQEMNGYFSDNEYLNQSEDITGTQDQRFYGENNYNRQHGSQERSRETFYKEWQNEGPQTQNAVPHTQDWSSYNSSYGCEEGCTEQWYNSTSRSKVGTGAELSGQERPKEKSSDATQHYYQQQPQYQCKALDHTSLLTGGVGQHGLFGEFAPHLDAARINMHPHLGNSLARNGSIAPELTEQFLETERSRFQRYMEFMAGHVQTATQTYMTQPMAYQATQVGHGVMSNPNYDIGPRTNPDQHFRHPVSGGRGQMSSQMLSSQAMCYGAHADLNFRAAGL